MPHIEINQYLPEETSGQRLDQALTTLFPDYSRARVQEWLKSGCLFVNGQLLKGRERVLGGEHITGCIVLAEETGDQAQDLPLDVRYADEDILVLCKPVGLVVHPAAGNPDGTLVNALLHHYPELAMLPRAGIVHRLDKDTSGLMVVARSVRAHTSLVEQLQVRSMGREYIAICNGVPTAGRTIDEPIARHGVDRQRMAVTPTGKPAVTHFRVTERFRAHALLRVKLETGRTHQIRVHLSYIRYPLIGDQVYGGRLLRLPPHMEAAQAEVIRNFRRQALHAARLSLQHPASGETLSWEADAPADFQALLLALRADRELHPEQDPNY